MRPLAADAFEHAPDGYEALVTLGSRISAWPALRQLTGRDRLERPAQHDHVNAQPAVLPAGGLIG